MDLIQVRKVEYRPLVHLVVVGDDDHIQVGNATWGMDMVRMCAPVGEE